MAKIGNEMGTIITLGAAHIQFLTFWNYENEKFEERKCAYF